jgi:hypothetical protein
MRWRLQLSEYDYDILYRASTQHSNADCLSRIQMVQYYTEFSNNDFLKVSIARKTREKHQYEF